MEMLLHGKRALRDADWWQRNHFAKSANTDGNSRVDFVTHKLPDLVRVTPRVSLSTNAAPGGRTFVLRLFS